jgi:hypothetical protein
MLLKEYADRTDQATAELFGGRFAAALSDLTPGAWHGPIPSAYGTHLVRPGERIVRVKGKSLDGIDAALDRLATGSVVAVTLPTHQRGRLWRMTWR